MTAAVAQIDLFSSVEANIRERIASAFRSSLEPCERAVLWAIEKHYGQASAIGIAEMQDAWRTNDQKVWADRAIKGAVKSLLEVHEIPIGSCRVPGRNGYFICITASDIEEAERALRNEIFSLFRRLKCISPKSAFVRELSGQMALLAEDNKAKLDRRSSRCAAVGDSADGLCAQGWCLKSALGGISGCAG